MLLTAFFMAALTQAALTQATTHVVPSTDVAPSTPLEQGLNAITTESLRADLYFLASDELRGRDTPSHEQRIAARYLQARIQRNGMRPGAGDAYLWPYELPYVAADFEKSGVSFTGRAGQASLELGVDYVFHHRFVRAGVTTGAVVFGGEAGKGDYSRMDLKGKWVLLRESGAPWWTVRDRVKDAGGIGILFVADPDDPRGKYTERHADWLEQMKTPGLKNPAPDALRMLYINPDAAERMLAAAETPAPQIGAELGYQLMETSASLPPGGLTVCENVCGLWPGTDLAHEVIIVSAHYDHVGVGDEGEIFNGADDNGSGTSTLLALSDALAAHGPMRRTVLLLWVSGEERGLLGSAAWTKNPLLPKDSSAICDINIDMVGRNAPTKLLITPTQLHADHNWLVQLAQGLCAQEGFPKLASADDYWKRSDQYNFVENMQIPACFLFSDVHEDYHEPTDTPDKIDYDKVRRVARLTFRMLDGLQADTLDFKPH